MTAKNVSPSQNAMDRVSRRWWFILVFICVNMVPPIVTKPLKAEEWARMSDIYGYILGHAFLGTITSPWWIIFNVLVIVLAALVFISGKHVSRIFSAYAAISFVFFAVLQSVSVTDRYGVGIVTCNFLWFLFLSVLWAWEAVAGLNDFSRRRVALWRWWVVPLMVWGFWLPFSPGRTGAFHFDPLFFIREHTGLAFCLTAPVYLGILTLFYPRVNLAVMRLTSLTGVILAFYNMLYALIGPSLFQALAHVPLMSISIYALVLSFRKAAAVTGAVEEAVAAPAANLSRE